MFSTAARRLRWVNIAPFARPVVPEVWMSHAHTSGSVSASVPRVLSAAPGPEAGPRSPSRSSSAAGCSPSTQMTERTEPTAASAGPSRSSCAALARTTVGSVSRNSVASSDGVCRVLANVAMVPASGSAYSAETIAGWLSETSATRSPGEATRPMPAAILVTLSCRSAKVQRSSPATNAGASRDVAVANSTIWCSSMGAS